MRGPNGNLQSRPQEMYVHLEWSNHRTLLEEGLSGSFMVLGLGGAFPPPTEVRHGGAVGSCGTPSFMRTLSCPARLAGRGRCRTALLFPSHTVTSSFFSMFPAPSAPSPLQLGPGGDRVGEEWSCFSCCCLLEPSALQFPVQRRVPIREQDKGVDLGKGDGVVEETVG